MNLGDRLLLHPISLAERGPLNAAFEAEYFTIP
jgi:hypothetical protein